MNPANRRGIARRAEVFEVIRQFIAEHGYSPTVRDVQRGAGLKGPGEAKRYIMLLTQEGELTFEPGKSRTIRLVEKARKHD